MEAFNVDRLSVDLKTQYDNMRADGINAIPCLQCNERVTFNEFMEIVESTKYSHEQIEEILMSGTHPECWKMMFCDTEYPYNADRVLLP